MKLIEKHREGSRVKKRYDKPRTPYQRGMESEQISKAQKQKLSRQYEKLNPAELKRQITRLQNRLIEMAGLKQSAQPRVARLAASRKG